MYKINNYIYKALFSELYTKGTHFYLHAAEYLTKEDRKIVIISVTVKVYYTMQT